MWIVRLALRRPYTFVVLSLMLFLLAPVVISRTPDRHFSRHRYPCCQRRLAVCRPLRRRDVRTHCLRCGAQLTTAVNNIEHVESQSMNGIAVIKIFLQPTRIFTRPLRRPPRHHRRLLKTAAGNHAAAGRHLQRIHRAHCSACAFRPGPQ